MTPFANATYSFPVKLFTTMLCGPTPNLLTISACCFLGGNVVVVNTDSVLAPLLAT
jgi:hypothetical protein